VSSSSYQLRPALLSDRPRIEVLRLAANPKAVSARREGDFFERWVNRQARDPRWGCFFMAEVNGVVEGYGLVGWWAPDLVEDPPPNAIPAGYLLLGTWVEPAHRRKGIGLALASKRLEWIRLRSSEAWYWTEHENIPSQRLHERLGFQPYSDDFWFPPRDRTDSRLYRLFWEDVAHRKPDPPAPEPPQADP
jgi:RimJ/RimL family protein N-acetyltransferase